MHCFTDRKDYPLGRKDRRFEVSLKETGISPSSAGMGGTAVGAWTIRATAGRATRWLIALAALLLSPLGLWAQFGSQTVGATATQSITVTATAAGTVSSVEVLTLGAPGGDYAVGTGSSNCTSAALAVNGTCTESVSFTPSRPGPRLGAVVLVGTVSSVRTVLGTAYLTGSGTGGLGVLASGNVLPVAGQFGFFTSVGDGAQATAAELDLPSGVVVDGAGNMYIADTGHNRIRMVCASATSATIYGTSCAGAGIISTIAGNGNPTYTGDGAAASGATLSTPVGLAIDGAGNLYIADSSNNAVREILAATGEITTVAGNSAGTVCGGHTDAVGDGCAATQATLNSPEGVTVDASGNLHIADTNNHRIRKVTASTGVITTVAGSGFANANGTGAYNGDGIAATSAELNYPYAVAFDASGNMYIPDSANHRIREVAAVSGAITSASTISTFAGTGNAGSTACGATPVAATTASVWLPEGVAVDAAGNVYIAETQNAAVRKVSSSTGLISTVAENGCGDFYSGGVFTEMEFYGPIGLFLDGDGNLYVTDTLNMVVREIQGNYAAVKYATPIRQGETSATDDETIENDGNAALTLTAITAGTNSAVDGTVTNGCTAAESLAIDGTCVVGAVFAPSLTPTLTANTTETPEITIAADAQASVAAANSPLAIQLVGVAEPVNSTTTTISSNPNPSRYGQSVTFTMTVTTGANTGSLTGTVTLKDTFGGSTTTLASKLAVNSSGLASYATSALAVGVHSIVASYDNTDDAAHSASSSDALSQAVNEGTGVVLSSSLNPSTVGASVTFTATVSSSGGGVTPTGTVTFYDGTTALATQAINAGGVTTYTTSTLANGVHEMTAEYNGDTSSEVASSTSATVNQDVQASSTLTVGSSVNPSNYGTSVTFTATVASSATQAATGTVKFYDNGAQIGTGTLSGSPAQASFAISTLIVGTHPITASYAGDNYNAASTTAAALSQIVNQAATQASVVAKPSPGIGGTAETITATVTLSSGTAPLTGTVIFTAGTTTLGSAALGSAGTATITPTLSAGGYEIVATYGGNTNATSSASAQTALTMNQATTQTTVSASPSPAIVLSSITFTATVSGNGGTPTSSVNFLANGNVIGAGTLSGGKATLSYSQLAAGSYSITAQYLGDTNDAASTSPVVSETVGTISTTTSLGTASTTGADAQVILTATVVNASTGPTPTGTVTFYSGTTAIGASTLDSSGVATLTPDLNANESYSIYAVYGGDSYHGASTSSVVTVSGTAVGFNLSVSPSSVTVATKQNTTVTVTMSSNSGFTDTIGMGCSSLPAAVTCHFSSASITLPANGTASVTLTIDTNNPLSGGSSAMNRRAANQQVALAGLLLPLSLGFGWIFWRLRRRNSRIFTMIFALAFLAATFAVSGCSNFSQSSAAPGSYTIQVTGTGTNSNVIHYQSVSLVITK